MSYAWSTMSSSSGEGLVWTRINWTPPTTPIGA